MSQVQLIALKAGSPDGNRSHKKGARYSIGDQAARFLVKIGWARLADSKESKPRKDAKD